MYEKALEMLKRHGERRILPYSNMADCYEILGDYELAIVCYQMDLEWYPDRTVFYEEIGDLYFYMKTTTMPSGPMRRRAAGGTTRSIF